MSLPPYLYGPVGPGFENNADDVAKLGAAIETDGRFAPFTGPIDAQPTTTGAALAPGVATTGSTPAPRAIPASGLNAGYVGAVMGKQIEMGTDPDGAILPNGATLKAMRAGADDRTDGGAGFARPPKITASVGRGGVNRPADVHAAQANYARLGYAPSTLDPSAPGYRRADPATVARANHAFQRNNGLKVDGIMKPGKETERAVHAQIGRAQRATAEAHQQATDETVRRANAGDPALKGVTNHATARSVAGLQVGQAVAAEKKERLKSVTAAFGGGGPNGVPAQHPDKSTATAPPRSHPRTTPSTRAARSSITQKTSTDADSRTSDLTLAERETYWRLLGTTFGLPDADAFAHRTARLERNRGRFANAVWNPDTEKLEVAFVGSRPRGPRPGQMGHNQGPPLDFESNARAEHLIESIRRIDPRFNYVPERVYPNVEIDAHERMRRSLYTSGDVQHLRSILANRIFHKAQIESWAAIPAPVLRSLRIAPTNQNWEYNVHVKGRPLGLELTYPIRSLIPRSFNYMTSTGQHFHLHPNATEHLMEYERGLHGKMASHDAIQIAVLMRLQEALSVLDLLPRRGSPNFYGDHNVGGYHIKVVRRPGDALPVINHLLKEE